MVDGGEKHDGWDEADAEQSAERLELPELSQRLLDPGEPGDLALFDDEADEHHRQEHAAEACDLGVGRVQDLTVVMSVGEGERKGVPRPQAAEHSDDDDRDDQAHAEDSDQDSPCKESLLPLRSHVLQYAGVDHRVVEAQADLEHREDACDADQFEVAGGDADHSNGGEREQDGPLEVGEDALRHRVDLLVVGVFVVRTSRVPSLNLTGHVLIVYDKL